MNIRVLIYFNRTLVERKYDHALLYPARLFFIFRTQIFWRAQTNHIAYFMYIYYICIPRFSVYSRLYRIFHVYHIYSIKWDIIYLIIKKNSLGNHQIIAIHRFHVIKRHWLKFNECYWKCRRNNVYLIMPKWNVF